MAQRYASVFIMVSNGHGISDINKHFHWVLFNTTMSSLENSRTLSGWTLKSQRIFTSSLSSTFTVCDHTTFHKPLSCSSCVNSRAPPLLSYHASASHNYSSCTSLLHSEAMWATLSPLIHHTFCKYCHYPPYQ